MATDGITQSIKSKYFRVYKKPKKKSITLRQTEQTECEVALGDSREQPNANALEDSTWLQQLKSQ